MAPICEHYAAAFNDDRLDPIIVGGSWKLGYTPEARFRYAAGQGNSKVFLDEPATTARNQEPCEFAILDVTTKGEANRQITKPLYLVIEDGISERRGVADLDISVGLVCTLRWEQIILA